MYGRSSLRIMAPSFLRVVVPWVSVRVFLFFSLSSMSRKVVSPSLRTTTSRLGHSLRAFSSQKLT